METQSDSELMGAVQGGDVAQLAVLFERHHLSLFRYLMHLTRNQPLSEDLVQEVFFRVLKYARTYDGKFSFSSWLYGMARNAYADSRHKVRGEVSEDRMPDIRSTDPIQEDVFSRKQDSELLQEALQALPEDKREVLVLSRFHDLRYEEIARIMKCEIGTVKVRAYRALRELREKFQELRGDKIYEV